MPSFRSGLRGPDQAEDLPAQPGVRPPAVPQHVDVDRLQRHVDPLHELLIIGQPQPHGPGEMIERLHVPPLVEGAAPGVLVHDAAQQLRRLGARGLLEQPVGLGVVAAQPQHVRQLGLGDDDGLHVPGRLGVGERQPARGRGHAELVQQPVDLGPHAEQPGPGDVVLLVGQRPVQPLTELAQRVPVVDDLAQGGTVQPPADRGQILRTQRLGPGGSGGLALGGLRTGYEQRLGALLADRLLGARIQGGRAHRGRRG